MSQTTIKADSAEPKAIKCPCCPHCGKDIPAVAHYMWQGATAVFLCVYCPHDECRKVLEMAIVIQQGDESRIASPH